MQRLNFIYALSILFASVSSDCNRGFEEHDRPLISVITKETVQRGDEIWPFWVDGETESGGNLVVDKSDHTSIVVPASGNYAIVVILDGVSGSSVRVFRQGSLDRRIKVGQEIVNSSGTTICIAESFLEINDRLTVGIEKGKSTSTSSLQLFAYLINLSAAA